MFLLKKHSRSSCVNSTTPTRPSFSLSREQRTEPQHQRLPRALRRFLNKSLPVLGSETMTPSAPASMCSRLRWRASSRPKKHVAPRRLRKHSLIEPSSSKPLKNWLLATPRHCVGKMSARRLMPSSRSGRRHKSLDRVCPRKTAMHCGSVSEMLATSSIMNAVLISPNSISARRVRSLSKKS